MMMTVRDVITMLERLDDDSLLIDIPESGFDIYDADGNSPAWFCPLTLSVEWFDKE